MENKLSIPSLPDEMIYKILSYLNHKVSVLYYNYIHFYGFYTNLTSMKSVFVHVDTLTVEKHKSLYDKYVFCATFYLKSRPFNILII